MTKYVWRNYKGFFYILVSTFTMVRNLVLFTSLETKHSFLYLNEYTFTF